ncbi:MAG TPA: response regulator [bacterium]|nr:response regulator [bacterium]
MKARQILIVEDEIDFAKMVKIRLESIGYEVKIAGDTYGGTQAIIHGNPDLIILDLMMPAGGGFSLLERIQAIPDKASIPVVILTGRTLTDDIRARAEKYKVESILSKPYEPEEFVQTIQSILPLAP